MSASYCFVLQGCCSALLVRGSIFAEHERRQVAAFMECVYFMQPRWPSRISTSTASRIYYRSLLVMQASLAGFLGAMVRHPSVLPSSRAHQNMGTRYGSDCDQGQRRPGWGCLTAS